MTAKAMKSLGGSPGPANQHMDLHWVGLNPDSSSDDASFTAIVDGELTHSGDLRLTRHIANAVLRMSPSGPRVVKETNVSGRHIDLAIAAILAFDQAAQVAPEPEDWDAWS